MDLCTFNYHYFSPLLDNLYKEANEVIVPLREFNVNILIFDEFEHASTFLNNLLTDLLQLQSFFIVENI